MVAKHHLAGGHGHIFAHGILQRLQVLAGSVGAGIELLAQVLQEKFPAFFQRRTLRFLGHAQHFGVGQQPVRGRHGVQCLPGKKVHHVLVVFVQAGGHVGHITPPAVIGLKAFLEDVVGPLVPALVGKATIFFRDLGIRRCAQVVPGLHSQLQGTLCQHPLLRRRAQHVQSPVHLRQRQGNRGQATRAPLNVRLQRLVKSVRHAAMSFVGGFRYRRSFVAHAAFLQNKTKQNKSSVRPVRRHPLPKLTNINQHCATASRHLAAYPGAPCW